jgi:hypothetical protein
MGKLLGGLNGPFIGKVGKVVGSSRNGIPYMKGLYKNRKKDISEKEILNRRKFAAAQLWLKPLLPFVRVGFSGYSTRSGGFTSAKSNLMRNVLKTDGENISIDPALVKVSSGDLPVAENAAFHLSGSEELIFTWEPVPAQHKHAKDQVMLLAYCIEHAKAFYVFPGQFRNMGTDTLPFYQTVETGSVLHVYIAFMAADRSRQSDSLYLGEVIVH